MSLSMRRQLQVCRSYLGNSRYIQIISKWIIAEFGLYRPNDSGPWLNRPSIHHDMSTFDDNCEV
jgi:hypothetical protein